ncbi:MAG: hypothetical protein LBC99_00725 [Spirochaetota bacterium]|nr:hypothetical protein [Spirochaetota bacterium]
MEGSIHCPTFAAILFSGGKCMHSRKVFQVLNMAAAFCVTILLLFTACMRSRPSSDKSADTGAQPASYKVSDADIHYMQSAKYTKAVRQEFYKLLNNHRKAHKLETFPGTANVDLEKYADLRAAEQKTHFGHTRPDGGNAASGWNNTKTTPKRRYTSECAASVIILHPDPVTTASNFFAAWKSSPAHNNIMLTPFSSEYNYEYVFGIAPEYYNNAFGIPGVRSGGVFAVGQWY